MGFISHGRGPCEPGQNSRSERPLKHQVKCAHKWQRTACEVLKRFLAGSFGGDHAGARGSAMFRGPANTNSYRFEGFVTRSDPGRGCERRIIWRWRRTWATTQVMRGRAFSVRWGREGGIHAAAPGQKMAWGQRRAIGILEYWGLPGFPCSHNRSHALG